LLLNGPPSLLAACWAMATPSAFRKQWHTIEVLHVVTVKTETSRRDRPLETRSTGRRWSPSFAGCQPTRSTRRSPHRHRDVGLQSLATGLTIIKGPANHGQRQASRQLTLNRAVWHGDKSIPGGLQGLAGVFCRRGAALKLGGTSAG
jgi:hypothetical protein